ncbi:Cyclophilin-like family protein [compost metagenome]
MTMSLVTTRSGHCQTAIEYRSARVRAMRLLGLLSGLFVLGGCGVAQSGTSVAPTAISTTAATAIVQSEECRMWMTVGERRFAITLADTEAARAFAAMLPLTIDMPDLNGNEKHAKLPKALPTSSIRPGTIRNGDLMLYGSQTLVVFYLTFDSIYSYTRLGRVDDPADLAQVLGKGTARITFSRD